MIKYLRVLVFLSILSPLPSHALSTTIVTKVSPTQLTLPKTQIVVPQTVAPTKVVVPVTPPTQAIIDAITPTSQTAAVAPPTPPTPLPQAPTNPPPTVSPITIPRTTLSTETRTVLTQAQSLSTTDKIDIDIRTGSDNLEPRREDCQRNPELEIVIRGKDPIRVSNINNGQSWPNNSVRRVTVPLDGTVKVEDLTSIEIRRSPVIIHPNCIPVADNWNVDKITVTASIKVDGRNQRTMLANVVSPGQGQPMFRFIYSITGTSRDPARTGTRWNWVFSLPRNVGNSTPSATSTNARIVATIATG